MTSNTRAVLFDLDGTLIDTTDLILRCFRHAWRTVCGREHSRQALIETFGMPLRDAMQRLLSQGNGNHRNGAEDGHGELVNRLLAEYRVFNVTNHDVIARPFDGVQRTIEELRRRGYRTGVVSSKGRELGMRGLRLCALEELVDTTIFLEDTEHHKPRPEPILAALDRLGLNCRQAAYVGDSAHDLMAGRDAGVRTVAALWGPWPRLALERESPDFLAKSLSDLLDIFQ